jgi:hypothetical protein
MPDNAPLKEKINLETSQIPWSELQRFFASGAAVFVDNALDLVEVAYAFSMDDKQRVSQWLATQQVALVSDEQARDWLNRDAQVWAVVVKPWILVQDRLFSDINV